MRVDTIDERLSLFRAMMEQAGIDPETGVVEAAQLRAAAQRCLGCRVADECHRWMSERTPEDPVPGFCRNEPTFTLWAEETIARELAARESKAVQGPAVAVR